MTQKIVILAANPKTTPALRLDQEMREIAEGLRRSKNRDQFVLEKRLAVRTEDLRRALLDERPRLLHFCGHGAGEDGILLEDVVGCPHLVKAEPLAKLFKLFSTQIECVILNACYSEFQAEAISQHINYVIGMKQAIGDKAAISFATGFYDAIGAGRVIEDAFEFGQNAIELDGIPEELTPVLKKKSNMNLFPPSIYQKSSVEISQTKLPGKELDQELFQRFLEELPSNGSIRFIKEANMAGFSFQVNRLDQLHNFSFKWADAEHEFIDPVLESKRKELFNLIEQYTIYVAYNTYPTHRVGFNTVPPEWEKEQPEQFWRVVDELHELAGKVVEAHQELVRLGRTQLS
ncbi:MAG: CHAT domain-containing protein [Nostoc sp. JL31]|uniref:CHAT domain-containing protein n=1 Tax=Nostoc sp. JL31 TaxID=2815395 RepID=UPI0025D58EFA|nr:CHAT domain-containing protein [Nostoc sp. JL31]MBN3890509.1 CHAT domain-containing protein [Nostoc sp. JL31]